MSSLLLILDPCQHTRKFNTKLRVLTTTALWLILLTSQSTTHKIQTAKDNLVFEKGYGRPSNKRSGTSIEMVIHGNPFFQHFASNEKQQKPLFCIVHVHNIIIIHSGQSKWFNLKILSKKCYLLTVWPRAYVEDTFLSLYA